MERKTCLCTSSQDDSTQGKEERHPEAEQAQGSRLWWWSLTGFIMGQLGWQTNVGTRLQHWLWWLLIFVNKAMETEEQMSVYFEKKKITQDDFALCSFSVSWFLFAQNGIYSYNRDIIPFLCAEFGLFHCWYILSKGEIRSYLSDNLSPHIFYWADQFWWDWTLYRLGILSIVRLNERLWRSEFPCISCLVSCFSSDLNFWILHPSRDFPPIEHFAAIDRALHTIVEK